MSSTTRSRSRTMPCAPPPTCRSATSRTATFRTRRSTSSTRPRHESAPPQLREAQRELDRMTKEKDGAINSQDYEAAAKLREDEAALREKVDTLRAEWQTTIAGDAPTVDEEEIAQVVAMWTGIPDTRISEAETERLLHMEESLHK